MMKGMIFAERYQLEDFIGQGGMSLVYRAVDIRTGHSVAVKILKSEYNSDKEFLERFQREAQAASLMSHHNIVNLLDVGVEGEYRYLVLEYVSGSTLKDVIRQKGRLNTTTAIQITVRILSALQHAHDNGIIHRDIKPQNVLIHSDGHVKVADFGIARMTNAFTISKGDTVVGSVHYSSPEQAMGGVVEATSDIYSTGVVMYEMLTGRVPFVGDTPVSVAMQHINDAPPPITDYAPETPPAVVAVVMKALAAGQGRQAGSRNAADGLFPAACRGSDSGQAAAGAAPETPCREQTLPARPGFTGHGADEEAPLFPPGHSFDRRGDRGGAGRADLRHSGHFQPGDQPGHRAGCGGLPGRGSHGHGQTGRAGLAADRAEQRPHPRRGGDLPAAGAGHGNEPGRQPAGHRQSGPQSGYHPRLRGAAV